MKSREFDRNSKYDFILPLGATEQHGPYAPFGTDTYIINYLVDQIEKEFPDIIIMPTIEYSLSEEHRCFFGTVYVSEQTMTNLLHEVCSSIYKRANTIYITCFHYISDFLDQFIKEKSEHFKPAKLIHLVPETEEDEARIEQMLGGPVDEHAGNTEISNMLVIDSGLVRIPTDNSEKTQIDNPFGTGNLAEKSKNGFADNHPEWIVNEKIGYKSLEIYAERMKGIISIHNEST
jgi:creatinine amidohydrolase